MAFAENRPAFVLEAEQRLSEFVFEKLIPPVKLKIREGVTLESARQLEGDFYESACNYYTLLETSDDSKTKIEALIDLSQQLINLGRFGQARPFLEQRFDRLSFAFSGRELNYFQARRAEKLGWIADYEGNFDKAVSFFSKAREIIGQIAKDQRTEEEESLFSTTTHFLGRAHFGLALKGKNRKENINLAIQFFNEDLSRAISLREAGKPIPQNEGFQHAWLARCYLAFGYIGRVRKEIEEVGRLFDEYLEKNPKRGIKAHYYLLLGALYIKTDNFKKAREEFEKALEIRLTKERYPKGEAEALAGVAGTYWAEGKIGQAFVYGVKAIKTYPLLLLRHLP